MLRRLSRLRRSKMLCERVGSGLQRLHRGRYRDGLRGRLRLEGRVRCRCPEWLGCLGEGAGKGVGGLACDWALLSICWGRCGGERGACLLVHEHRLAEGVGGLLRCLEPLEGRHRGILERGNRVLWNR